MNAVPSMCLGGEGYLEQYFKGFIKLVAVTEKISAVKSTYLFPLSFRCLTGGGGGGASLCPISAPKCDYSGSFWNCLLTEAKACFPQVKVFLLFNQVKEWLEAQSPEPTCLFSNPGASTCKLCDPKQVCWSLSVRFPFCSIETMAEQTWWRNVKFQRVNTH